MAVAGPGQPAARENGGDALVLRAAGKHILCVDEDDAIVHLMTRLLQRQGYPCERLHRREAALAAVRAGPDSDRPNRTRDRLTGIK